MRDLRARGWLFKILSAFLTALQKLTYRYLHPDAVSFARLKPKGPVRGNVLLAHVVEPFVAKSNSPLPTSHTHFGEAFSKVQSLLDLGFAVDVISYRNTVFQPRRRYDMLISSRVNFERLARSVGPSCIKVLDLDVAHWLFNNAAATKRALDLQSRRKVTLTGYRLFEEVWAIEAADYVMMLGSQFTYDTYRFADKPVFQMPNPAIKTYPWPADKDFNACRSTFLWLGSRGPVHKGLDLVLEAFAAMPAYQLIVCGPVAQDQRFMQLYQKELLHTPNINLHGWVDVASPAFEKIALSCVGLVYPSASEGCAGAVITSMHAGLLPIISYESGVDLPSGCGVLLKENTIKEIQEQVCAMAALPAGDLEITARKIWEFARARHTQSGYRHVFKKVMEDISRDEDVRTLSGFIRLTP